MKFLDCVCLVICFILFFPVGIGVVDLIAFSLTNDQLTSLRWKTNEVLQVWTFVSLICTTFFVIAQ